MLPASTSAAHPTSWPLRGSAKANRRESFQAFEPMIVSSLSGKADARSGHDTRPILAFWPHNADPELASTRIRCFQVVKGLKEQGRDASVFGEGKTPPDVLVLCKRYDKASIEQAAGLRAKHGTRLVLDLCDNHFYYKDSAAHWVQRAEILRNAVRRVDQVVTASSALAEIVRGEVREAKRVTVIGDALDEGVPILSPTLSQRLHAARLGLFLRMHPVEIGRRLLWFGNHGSSYADGGMQDLSLIADALHRHHQAKPVTLTVISNNRDAYRKHLRGWTLPTLYLPWSASLFQQTLASHTIAVIPAQLNPFTACKTNNRVATAFCNGLAVIAARIPSYEEFEDLAMIDDWDVGLGTLMANSQDRLRRISEAKQRLMQRYNLKAISNEWAAMCDKLTTGRELTGQ